MKEISYTTKIRLLCFVLGPIVLVMGILFMLSELKLFNILANAVGIIGIIVMFILQFGKFEKEDESAVISYGKAASTVLELILIGFCGAEFISLISDFEVILTPEIFAIIAGAALVALGIFFYIFDNRRNY